MSAEVFPHPTVQEVAFEIRYPHMFIIENKIGEFQEGIITEFPDSQLVLERQMVLTSTGPEGKLEKVPEQEPPVIRKLWVFKSEKGYEVRVATNSLVIVSHH